MTSQGGYQRLKQDIIRGLYQPDEKLPMGMLTRRYAQGVGRCARRWRSWWLNVW